ncbi:Common plant regulatory factor, partial [Musa troglodytarum]
EPPTNPPYPEWAAMQAYFGAGMMPPPYFSTAVAPSHAPHPYMWGPQPLVPPFGSPYTAIYPHGGVYAHPSVPLGSHTHYQGISPSPATSEAVVLATPLSVEMPAKSSKNKDKSLVKKLKGLDGLALSGGNGIIDRDQVDGNSGYNSTEGSSDGSNGDNAERGIKDQRRQRSEDGPSSGPPALPPSAGDDKCDASASATGRLRDARSRRARAEPPRTRPALLCSIDARWESDPSGRDACYRRCGPSRADATCESFHAGFEDLCSVPCFLKLKFAELVQGNGESIG